MRKGLSTLLAAYQQLRNAPPLVLVGYETPDTPKSFPAGVMVLRNAPHANVMAAWERAAFGVMPSLWPDPSPGVVREAMSKGKAVVGTAIGGASEMIEDGKTGFLVPPGDAALMASAMQQLIDDPALCRAFGRAAQTSAEQFMASVSVPRFEQLYQRLIHGAAQTNLVSQPITVG
jgi:glycosyltransferase involved in cell wall biosynthesis